MAKQHILVILGHPAAESLCAGMAHAYAEGARQAFLDQFSADSQGVGFAVLGGWPGAWFAQSVLRHKTRKPSFQLAFKATIALHCLVLLAWLIWPPFVHAP